LGGALQQRTSVGGALESSTQTGAHLEDEWRSFLQMSHVVIQAAGHEEDGHARCQIQKIEFPAKIELIPIGLW
jgi:hypothetical protein